MTPVEVLKKYHKLINSNDYKDIILRPEDLLTDFTIKPSELNNKIITFCENSFISKPTQKEIEEIYNLINLFDTELECYFLFD